MSIHNENLNMVNENVSNSKKPKMITEVQEYGTGNSVSELKMNNGIELYNEQNEDEKNEETE